MPKTLDIQGFSVLREGVVRSQGRTSCSSVLQEIRKQHPQTCYPASIASAVGAVFLSRLVTEAAKAQLCRSG